jgi:AraC-like DNA-binding protein
LLKKHALIFHDHTPAAPLGDHVQQIMYFKGYQPGHSTQRIVPDGTIYLIFELDGIPRHVLDNVTHEPLYQRTRAWISGMHQDFLTIDAVANGEMYVIRFRAAGLYPFIGQDVDALNDRVESPEAWFGDGVFDFRERLLNAETAEEKIALGEEWLRGMFSEAHLPRPEVLQVEKAIRSDPGMEMNSILGLIEATALSRKHFATLFRRYIGLPPKQYQRVLRFNEIISAIHKQEKVEWAQIALGCGYYDQAHFIKEFKRFCGINPSDFISNYRDYEATNFFPLD